MKADMNEFDVLVSETIDGQKDPVATEKLGALLQTDKDLQKDFLDQLWMHNLLSEYYAVSPESEKALPSRPLRRVTFSKAMSNLLRPLKKLALFQLN